MQDYAQYESVGAMRDAAKNTGGVAGMGIGLGAGVGIGQMFAQNFGNAQTANSHQNNAQNSNAEQQMSCPSCNAKIKVGAKFCPECGKPISINKFCSKCGATVKSSAKFCPECGEKL
ncbi:MAG: zinc-ribbon domain-containing protein [Clostridia bacterium]